MCMSDWRCCCWGRGRRRGWSVSGGRARRWGRRRGRRGEGRRGEEKGRLRQSGAENETRLKRLSALWMEVIERKRDLRGLKVPLEKARAGLGGAVAKGEGFGVGNPRRPQGRR